MAPYPTNITKITVTGTFLGSDGNPFVSTTDRTYVTFQPKYEKSNVMWLKDPTAATPTILVPAPIKCFLNGSGSFAWSMPATDEPDLIPRGWQYEVNVMMGQYSAKTFLLSLPAAGPSTVDISTVIPL